MKPSITHASFTIERIYPDVTPARVYAAFTPEQKTKWFAGDEWQELEHEHQFAVGGREINIGRHKSGVVSAFESRYYDLVEGVRLIYSYVMHLDDVKISVSLATIELEARGTSTRLVMHEDGAFLDGYDKPESRRHGTEWLLGRLGETLATI